jgi:hypothetical protein
MITINTQAEFDELMTNGNAIVYEDLNILCDITIGGSINALNIYSKLSINAQNISAIKIEAYDINAQDIYACNIYACNITAQDISAHNILACNINALDIYARNIDAVNINARKIKYYAVCFAQETLSCVSIEGKRKNCKHFCLDSEIIIKKDRGENETTN